MAYLEKDNVEREKIGKADVGEARERRKNKIRWSIVAIGLIFVFNPNVAIIDPLPDMFGYIIISLGLLKPSMLCEELADARRAFERLILLDLGKLLCVVWVFGVNGSNNVNSSLLLWTFVFGILEVVFVLPAFGKLFDGFNELGNFHVNTAIHSSKKPGGQSYTDKIKRSGMFLVVFKAIMAVLPELITLETHSYNENTAFFNLYRYIGVMRGFCFVPVLAVGIVWLVKMLKYFWRISHDKAFCQSVNNAYLTKVVPRKGLFIVRNVRVAAWFFIASAVLTLDFKIDGVNIFPDVVTVLLLGISFFYLCKISVLSKKATVITSVLYGISTLLVQLTDNFYRSNYTYNAMEKSDDAFFAYLVCVGAVVIQGILFICLLASVFKQVRTVIVEHTGYVKGREIVSEGEQTQVKAFQDELTKSFSHLIDVAMIYAASDVLYSLYGAFYAFMDKNLGVLGVVNTACGILFIGMSVRAFGSLREAVATKYMLE